MGRPNDVATLLDLLDLEVRSREMTSLMTGSDTSVKIEPTWNEVKDNIQGSSSTLTVNICLFGTLCDFFVTIDVFFVTLTTSSQMTARLTFR